MEFWKIFDFSESFRRLDPPWNTGQKKFLKSCPKTCSKHVWTVLGTILGILGFLKKNWFFWKLSKTRPSMEHWAIFFFGKIAPKHVQNTFEHYWERFWAFLDFRKKFDFFENFRRLDPPWNTGQKKFLKNGPKTCSKHVWTLLGTIFGILGILKNFDFFENFRRLDPPWNTGQKKNSEKLHQNMLKTRLGTFGNDFGHFCNFENFLIFLKFFADLTLRGTLGRKNSKKLPQNMFKKRLDTFGNDFWHFWNSEKFLIFLKVFADLTLHETLGKKNFWKAAPKHVQSTFEQFWERFWTFFGIFKNDFRENFRRHDPPWSTGQIFFSEKLPQNMFKTRLNTIGNDFGHFWIFEKKLIFLKNFEDWTLHETLGKKNSEKLPQNMFKTSLTTIGNDFRHFWNFEKFWFFWKPSKTGPSMEHWAEKKSEKLHQKMLKTRLNNFGNDFGHSLEFSKMIFLKTFEDTTLHGALGKFFFRKNCPKTCSKHVWTLLGTILGILGFLKKKWFFRKLSKTGTSMEHWTKNFGKLHQNMFKRRLDNFRNDFGHFWNFENFLTFLKFFADLTLHGTLGRNKFSEKLPQNMFKTRLNTIGNDFGHFWIFEKILIFLKIFADLTLDGKLDKRNFFGKIAPKRVQNTFAHFWKRFWSFLEFESFLIFLKIFAVSTLHGTLGKKISKKIAPKHVQNKFGQFWERFWAFLEFWKLFDFSESFGRLDPPWNTGQKTFSEKLPQNMFKARLNNFGNVFGHFLNFQNWFFWKLSKTRPSKEHWANFFFGKIAPKHVQNTFEHYWERFWAFLDFWKILIFLKNFED